MRFKNIIQNRKGITLIELLVTISISAIIFSAILSLFKEGLISYDRTVNEADLQLQLRHVQNVIKQDIVTSKIGKLGANSFPKKEEENKLILFIGTENDPSFIEYFVGEDDGSLYRLVYRIEDGNRVILNNNYDRPILEDISDFTIVIDNNLVKVTIAKNEVSSYSNQSIDKDVFIQAKPHGKIE